MKNRLIEQIRFLTEIDKLKHIQRQTLLLDRSRRENDAEHSWHLAVMAVVLAEHADHPDLDLTRVIKMVLIHDLVEIDAGDAYAYDPEAQQAKAERELVAADRIFALLPDDQAREFRALWDEFEERATPEARFAAALDRMQPLLHNILTEGEQWKKHGVVLQQVIERCSPIEDGSAFLWNHMRGLLDEAIEAGHLQR